MEPAIGKPVGHLLEQGLVGGLPTPQPIELHHISIEVHLRPDQPIQPLAVHLEPAVEQLHHPRGVGPPDVDDSPPWPGLMVQLPPLGKGPPSRGRRWAATKRDEWPSRSDRSACSNRAQTFACQVPL